MWTIPRILLHLIIMSLGFSTVYFCNHSPEFFNKSFAVEDGYIEWATVLALLLLASMFLKKFQHKANMKWFYLLFALACFFGAGEEISWGQRIFDIRTPIGLEHMNVQRELTFHNLEVGDIHLSYVLELILFGTIILYFFLTSSLAFHKRSKEFLEKLELPIPHWIQFYCLLVLIWTAYVAPCYRKREPLELAFTLLVISLTSRAQAKKAPSL